uniref:Uncharacterized protein n=1 Tax=Glossina pallidipes TaxID=7398 RepID=A0A1A9ZYY1_GLOPL
MSSHSFTNSTTVITTANGSVTGVWEAVTAGLTVSEISSSKDFSIARSIGGLFVPSVSDDSREAGEEDFDINVLGGKRVQLLSLESLLPLVDGLMLADLWAIVLKAGQGSSMRAVIAVAREHGITHNMTMWIIFICHLPLRN